jgi:hypothetical protein
MALSIKEAACERRCESVLFDWGRYNGFKSVDHSPTHTITDALAAWLLWTHGFSIEAASLKTIGECVLPEVGRPTGTAERDCHFNVHGPEFLVAATELFKSHKRFDFCFAVLHTEKTIL